MKKIEDQRKKDSNLKFVARLRNSNSQNQVGVIPASHVNQSLQPAKINNNANKVPENKERSHTKKSEIS